MRFIETVLWVCVAGTLVALLCVAGCTLLNPTTGEEQVGLPTAVTAEILRGMADDVELWDINKDGLNTDQELVALGLAVGQRLLVAWQQHNVETGLVDRGPTEPAK